MLPTRVANLRAEVWRLAAQPPDTESAFVSTLLEHVGMALLTSSASFYERVGDAFRCTREWLGDQGRSELGCELSAEVAWALSPAGTTTVQTPEQIRAALTVAGVSIPRWFEPWLDGPPPVKSALIVPVAHDSPEGWLLVLTEMAEGSPGAFPPETRVVVEEVVQIVSLVLGRKRAEQAFRANEQRYRSLVENLGEGVGIMDEQERFLFANPAGHEIFGVPAGTLPNRNLVEFLDDDAVERVVRQTGMRRQGVQSTYELSIRRPDGSKRVIVVTAVPERDADGRFVASIGSFRDVTEQRQAEAERQRMEARMHHAQKLESLGLLAGGIAHDFNNLLVGVMANADLALALAPPGSPLSECLEDILAASRRATELTSQMLAYAGKGRVQIQHIDLRVVVQEMGVLLRASISKNASVRVETSPDLPTFDGDATQIRQIVMNMMTNASDALGSDPGVITLRTGVVGPTDELVTDLVAGTPKPEPHVFVEVTDTGCGMDEATRARMFDPFFTTKFRGRGLGLAAVLGIVRSHHGTIQVRSSPGQGTTFRVLFPVSPARPAVAPPRPSVAAPEWRGHGLVLVVDDEEVVRKTTARMLSRVGFEPLSSADGIEAMECIRARGEELRAVILDLTMPRMGGEEVFGRIRALYPNLPVIMASGFDEKEAERRLAGQGISAFLRKPFDLHALVNALRPAVEEKDKEL